MNRNTLIAIVIVLLVCVGLGSWFVVTTINDNAGTSMSVVFYDDNGNVVYETSDDGSIPQWIGTATGAAVVKAVVTITYTIISSSDEPADVSVTDPTVSGTLYITEVFGNAVLPDLIDFPDLVVPLSEQTTLSGTYTYELDLTTFLSSQGGSVSIEYGWKIGFQTELNAAAKADGTQYTSRWVSNPLSYQLFWNDSETPSAIVLEGTIGIGLN